MAKERPFLTRLRDSNWFITLFSTMFGVIFGLYLTKYFEDNALLQSKEKAFYQVLQELESNEALLRPYDSILRKKFEGFSVFSQHLSDDFAVSVHKDSLEVFLERTGSVLTYENSEPLPNNMLRVSGELNLYIESNLILNNLPNTIWESYKQTNYMSVTPFDCLANVESFYELQEDVNSYNTRFKALLFEQVFIGNKDSLNEYLRIWNALLLKQNILLQMYAEKDSFLSDCR